MQSPNEVRPPSRRFALVLAWLTAIAFALAALWLLGIAFNLRTANGLLETERDLARVSDRLARSQLEERTFLAEKIITDLNARTQQPDDLGHLRVVMLDADRAHAPDARVAIVWDPLKRTGLLVATNLPALASGEILQLWAESTGRTQSIGTFEVEGSAISASFALSDVAHDFKSFRLTIEPSPAPTAPGARTIASGEARG